MLQIRPIKFFVKALEVGALDEMDLQLPDRDPLMSLEAVRINDTSVGIHLHLKVIVQEKIGMKLTYVVDFQVADSIVEDFKVTTETLADTFLQVNAPAIAYPYLRAYVTTICVNSGYTPLLLPPVNFQAIFNEKRKAQKPVTGIIDVTKPS